VSWDAGYAGRPHAFPAASDQLGVGDDALVDQQVGEWVLSGQVSFVN
jgi:hypothetical protein